MKNKYVNFVTDVHLITCISNLHKAYMQAKNEITKKKFFSNKIDTIKLTFDSNLNQINEEILIETEILRQVDKSLENAIGTFHEEVIDGIAGFERGKQSGYDIKSSSNNIFADIKNKHNTMNSGAAESLYIKLSKFAEIYPESKCYWVQILSKSSFNKKWTAKLNGTLYNHDRVYKISGDKFYQLITNEDDAFFQLYKALPNAINDYLKTIKKSETIENSAFTEIKNATEVSKRKVIDQITFENFNYYLGFDKL